jgi:glycosyltransferase involved in cell wall biosynthesis
MELTLVIPTYNEADSIGQVIQEWHDVIRKCIPPGKFRMLVINDGSTDDTLKVLQEIKENCTEVAIHNQSNRGHGQACLEGYKIAATLGSEFTMQIDSDGQCDPVFFPMFWERRRLVCLYGRRFQRLDGMARKWISLCLRWMLYLLMRTSLHDTNVPYRIYPTAWAAEAASQVPRTFDLANIAVALLLEPRGIDELPILFRARAGGTASVKWVGFVRKAFRLVKDLKSLKVSRV